MVPHNQYSQEQQPQRRDWNPQQMQPQQQNSSWYWGNENYAREYTGRQLSSYSATSPTPPTRAREAPPAWRQYLAPEEAEAALAMTQGQQTFDRSNYPPNAQWNFSSGSTDNVSMVSSPAQGRQNGCCAHSEFQFRERAHNTPQQPVFFGSHHHRRQTEYSRSLGVTKRLRQNCSAGKSTNINLSEIPPSTRIYMGSKIPSVALTNIFAGSPASEHGQLSRRVLDRDTPFALQSSKGSEMKRPRQEPPISRPSQQMKSPTSWQNLHSGNLQLNSSVPESPVDSGRWQTFLDFATQELSSQRRSLPRNGGYYQYIAKPGQLSNAWKAIDSTSVSPKQQTTTPRRSLERSSPEKTKRRKTGNDADEGPVRMLSCGCCEKRYDTLSALSLHMRLKHPHFVRTMMGLQNSDSLLAIHGRSVAAYLNNCMKTSYPVPTLSVSEARAKLGIRTPAGNVANQHNPPGAESGPLDKTPESTTTDPQLPSATMLSRNEPQPVAASINSSEQKTVSSTMILNQNTGNMANTTNNVVDERQQMAASMINNSKPSGVISDFTQEAPVKDSRQTGEAANM